MQLLLVIDKNKKFVVKPERFKEFEAEFDELTQEKLKVSILDFEDWAEV